MRKEAGRIIVRTDRALGQQERIGGRGGWRPTLDPDQTSRGKPCSSDVPGTLRLFPIRSLINRQSSSQYFPGQQFSMGWSHEEIYTMIFNFTLVGRYDYFHSRPCKRIVMDYIKLAEKFTTSAISKVDKY